MNEKKIEQRLIIYCEAKDCRFWEGKEPASSGAYVEFEDFTAGMATRCAHPCPDIVVFAGHESGHYAESGCMSYTLDTSKINLGSAPETLSSGHDDVEEWNCRKGANN